MKVNLISKSETHKILESVSNQWKQKTPKIKNLKVHFIDNNTQLMIGDGITILKINEIDVENATLDFVSKFDSDFKILKEIKTANKYIPPTYANGIVFIEKIN